MNYVEWLRQENKKLLEIAIASKRLLLSDEIPDATPLVMDLCELVERYEAEMCELPPKLKSYGKKPWYAGFDDKGQVASLSEIVELSESGL